MRRNPEPPGPGPPFAFGCVPPVRRSPCGVDGAAPTVARAGGAVATPAAAQAGGAAAPAALGHATAAELVELELGLGWPESACQCHWTGATCPVLPGRVTRGTLHHW